MGPQAFALIKPHIERVLRGEPVEYEAQIPYAASGKRWVRVNYIPDRDAHGAIVGWVASIVDITERKRVEESLRSRARQQQAVATLGELALRERDLQTVLDRSKAVVAETLDVELCKVLELLPGQSALLLRAGVGWNEGLVGTATVGVAAGSQAGYTLRVGSPVVVLDLSEEKRFAGPRLLFDHNVVSGMSCIIRSSDGTAWGVLGTHAKRRVTFTADDISFLVAVANILGDAIHRDRTERALRASEERFRLMANVTPTVIWTAAPDGTITWCSDRWLEYTGLAREENPAKWPQVLHPDDADSCMLAWQRAIKSGTPYEVEVRNRRHDGEYRWFVTRAIPIRNAAGHIVEWYGSTTDIHDRKQAEQALHEADRRKDAFLATLAHELRNPLAPIGNALELMKRADAGVDVIGDARQMLERQLAEVSYLGERFARKARLQRELGAGRVYYPSADRQRDNSKAV